MERNRMQSAMSRRCWARGLGTVLMAGCRVESAIIGRFLSREIDRRKRAGVGFAVTQTGGDPTRNVSADRAPIGARDFKPEDSDSFRLTEFDVPGHRPAFGHFALKAMPESFRHRSSNRSCRSTSFVAGSGSRTFW